MSKKFSEMLISPVETCSEVEHLLLREYVSQMILLVVTYKEK